MPICKMRSPIKDLKICQVSVLKNIYLVMITVVAVFLYSSAILSQDNQVAKAVPAPQPKSSLPEEFVLNREKSEDVPECITPVYDPKGAAQDDPELIRYIQRELLKPPSVRPYQLQNPENVHFSQLNQSIYANTRYLHGMRDGFFIEVGAADGEYLSNSLYFERELGWRGLLIEPFVSSHNSLLKKNRKAYSINTALSTSTKASEATFNFVGRAGVGSHLVNKNQQGAVTVRALPLYSLILALDVQVVDFLSLDIEAYEVKVLKTLPWDKVKFRLMCIEFPHIPEGLDYMTEFVTSKGYTYLGTTLIDAWYAWPELLNQTMTPSKQ